MKKLNFNKLIKDAGLTPRTLARDLNKNLNIIKNWAITGSEIPTEIIKYLEAKKEIRKLKDNPRKIIKFDESSLSEDEKKNIETFFKELNCKNNILILPTGEN